MYAQICRIAPVSHVGKTVGGRESSVFVVVYGSSRILTLQYKLLDLVKKLISCCLETTPILKFMPMFSYDLHGSKSCLLL